MLYSCSLKFLNRGNNKNDYALTTGEGSGFDYTVSTNQVKFLYSRADPPEDITFIFRTDAIAQEENETLILELVTTSGTNAPPSGDGVYFRNTINLTIVDSDSKISVVTMCQCIIVIML